MKIKQFIILLIAAAAIIGCGGGGDISDGEESISQKEWKGATLIENINEECYCPKVGIDDKGDAIVVWATGNSLTFSKIYATRYIKDSGWEEPNMIRENDQNIQCPKLAVNKNGNAIVAWQEKDDSGKWNIYAKQYTKDSGWDETVLIDGEISYSDLNINLAINENGNAVVIWKKRGIDGNENIYAKQYFAGRGWDVAHLLEHTDEKKADFLNVAMDSNNNIITVWRTLNNINKVTGIYINQYRNGLWNPEATIIDNNEGDYIPRLAMNRNGKAIIAWTQTEDWHKNIYTKEYLPGRGWSETTLVESTDELFFEIELTINNKGNAILAWVKWGDGKIYAKSLINGTWSDKMLVYSNSSIIENLNIAMDNNNNALAILDKKTELESFDIYSSVYINDKGWQEAVLIMQNAYNPQIAMDDDGNAIAVWGQYNEGHFSIYANRFAK